MSTSRCGLSNLRVSDLLSICTVLDSRPSSRRRLVYFCVSACSVSSDQCNNFSLIHDSSLALVVVACPQIGNTKLIAHLASTSQLLVYDVAPYVMFYVSTACQLRRIKLRCCCIGRAMPSHTSFLLISPSKHCSGNSALLYLQQASAQLLVSIWLYRIAVIISCGAYIRYCVEIACQNAPR